MESRCISDVGNCLLSLGRLELAAAAFEQATLISELQRDERAIAINKVQLGTVRLEQLRYPEALDAYFEARTVFIRLNDLKRLAQCWHMTGIAYQYSGFIVEAEDAFRQSLTLTVALNDTIGQAGTLDQLGSLYRDGLCRPEESATFFKQAAEIFFKSGDRKGEGHARYNLGITLHQIGRLEAARQEIYRFIKCEAQFGHTTRPWTTWKTIADIETTAKNPSAAAEARAKAIDCYLAYRRDGGENHDPDGRIALEVSAALLAGDPEAPSQIQAHLNHPELPDWLRPFILALQAIAAGSRDRSLADSPDLQYTSVAEILLLLEKLENR